MGEELFPEIHPSAWNCNIDFFMYALLITKLKSRSWFTVYKYMNLLCCSSRFTLVNTKKRFTFVCASIRSRIAKSRTNGDGRLYLNWWCERMKNRESLKVLIQIGLIFFDWNRLSCSIILSNLNRDQRKNIDRLSISSPKTVHNLENCLSPSPKI